MRLHEGKFSEEEAFTPKLVYVTQWLMYIFHWKWIVWEAMVAHTPSRSSLLMPGTIPGCQGDLGKYGGAWQNTPLQLSSLSSKYNDVWNSPAIVLLVCQFFIDHSTSTWMSASGVC